MPLLPLRPHLKVYHGPNACTEQKVDAHNILAQRIAEYVNTLVANDPRPIQSYTFAKIAADLGLTKIQVRSAVLGGVANGLMFSVTSAQRQWLSGYVKADGVR